MDEESQLVAKAVADTKKLFRNDRASGGLPLISIPMIVIGHLYLFDCKVQPYIPIFLLVGGYGSIVTFLLQTGMRCCWEDNTECKVVRFWYYLISFFLFVWCIVGSVWVYGVEKVDYEDITSVSYCNKTLYLFSWWMLTLTWSICAIIIFLACCAACCAACLGVHE